MQNLQKYPELAIGCTRIARALLRQQRGCFLPDSLPLLSLKKSAAVSHLDQSFISTHILSHDRA